MPDKTKIQGFSLVEMMIVVGIVGIVATIGIPMYQGNIVAARASQMNYNIGTIQIFQDDRKLWEGEYIQGTYDPADPDNAAGLKNVLGWDPQTESDAITYVIVCTTVGATPPECSPTSGYTVTATHKDGGDPFVKTF